MKTIDDLRIMKIKRLQRRSKLKDEIRRINLAIALKKYEQEKGKQHG